MIDLFFWSSVSVIGIHLIDVSTVARTYYVKDDGSLDFSSGNYPYSSHGTVHITFPLYAA